MNLFKRIQQALTKSVAVKYLAKIEHNPYKQIQDSSLMIKDAEFEEIESSANLPKNRIRALSPDLKEHEFISLYESGDTTTKCRLIVNSNFPWKVLGTKAASDPEDLVREYAASACRDPVILERMLTDKNEKVLWELANNPACPEKILEVLRKSQNTSIALAASIER